MNLDEQFESLRRKLNEDFKWPQTYMFKFILVKENTDAKSSLLLLFSGKAKFMEKDSSTGKYVSITITDFMKSAEEVIEIYKKVSGISGIMAL